jgi:hypothetical protein
VAIAVAQITVGGLTAMPNVREKDISISARNHEPDSFSQFPDNHERRPLAEVVSQPKLLVKTTELLTNLEAYVDVPLEVLFDELGEGGVISHLMDKRATVKLAPTVRQLVKEMQEPRTLGVMAPVITEERGRQGSPSTSTTPVLTEKQKALGKLSAQVPRTSNTVLSATQLSTAEWLQYRHKKPRVFKFLNRRPEAGVSAQFCGMNFCQLDTFMADTGVDIMLVTE